MKEFSVELESKLDKAYKAGATKKYGYDSIAKTAKGSTSAGSDDPKSRKEDRMLNKVANQAQSYLEMNSASSILGGSSTSSFSNAGKKAFKALPPSIGLSTNGHAGIKTKKSS